MSALLSSRKFDLLVAIALELRQHKWHAGDGACSCGFTPTLAGRGDPSVLHPGHQAARIVSLLRKRGLL